MAVTHIPGRRVSNGEEFYTDWTQRGGDSLILRAEVLKLVEKSPGVILEISVETRKEPGDTVTTIAPTEPASPTVMTLDGQGLESAYYEAGGSSGLQDEVRLKVKCTGGGAGTDYVVARVFPPVFFDNAKG